MKNVFKKAVASVASIPALLFPGVILAADAPLTGLGGATKGLEAVGAGGKLSTTSLPTLIGNLINVVLGVMGIVFVVLIVYAGILYMQAGTDPKKADTAKKIIVNAVIGLVLVVAAYAISTFIINQIAGAVV